MDGKPRAINRHFLGDNGALRKWNTEISRFIAFCNERQYHEENVRYLQPETGWGRVFAPIFWSVPLPSKFSGSLPG